MMEWYGAGAKADPGAWSGGSGRLHSSPVISVLFGLRVVDHLSFHLSAGINGSGRELRYLAGSPGGAGDIESCHTLIRVHTV